MTYVYGKKNEVRDGGYQVVNNRRRPVTSNVLPSSQVIYTRGYVHSVSLIFSVTCRQELV